MVDAIMDKGCHEVHVGIGFGFKETNLHRWDDASRISKPTFKVKFNFKGTIFIVNCSENYERVGSMLEISNSGLLDCLETIPGSEDEEIHVLMNNQKEGIFLCPACDNSVVRDLGKFVKVQAAIRVKCTCKCGHVFRVLVERRRTARKSVNLVGMCHFNDKSRQTKKCLIKLHDVSSTGLQFSVNSSPEFKVGDQIIVDFRLNDSSRSEIKEKGTVVRIKSKNIGLKFESTERCRPLKLFLMK